MLPFYSLLSCGQKLPTESQKKHVSVKSMSLVDSYHDTICLSLVSSTSFICLISFTGIIFGCFVHYQQLLSICQIFYRLTYTFVLSLVDLTCLERRMSRLVR